MRTPILYLANSWTKFKMLLTSNRFLYLIRFLLLSFPLIPQFIAHFWPICLLLFTLLYWLPVAQKWELLLKAGKGRTGKEGKDGGTASPGKSSILSKNHRKRWFRASGNKIQYDFFRKISYFCKNKFPLCLRMAEIRHLSFLWKIRISIGRLCTFSEVNLKC